MYEVINNLGIVLCNLVQRKFRLYTHTHSGVSSCNFKSEKFTHSNIIPLPFHSNALWVCPNCVCFTNFLKKFV